MLQLSRSQIAELKALLATVNLDVRPMPKPRKAKVLGTVKDVLSRSKWYKPASLSTRGIVTTARNLSAHKWEAMRKNPAKYGLCFPYRKEQQ